MSRKRRNRNTDVDEDITYMELVEETEDSEEKEDNMEKKKMGLKTKIGLGIAGGVAVVGAIAAAIVAAKGKKDKYASTDMEDLSGYDDPELAELEAMEAATEDTAD